MKTKNDILESYREITENKFSPYDYVALDDTHYLELKTRLIPSTKYSDCVIDDLKMAQLLKLDKPTLLLTEFTDNKLYAAWLTVETKEGLKINPIIKSFTKKARATTNFARQHWIDKLFHSIQLDECKEIV